MEQDEIDRFGKMIAPTEPAGTPKCEDCGFKMARGELDRSGQEYFCPVCAKAGIRIAENKRLRDELSQAKRDAERLRTAATDLREHLTSKTVSVSDVPDSIWLPFIAALAKREGEVES